MGFSLASLSVGVVVVGVEVVWSAAGVHLAVGVGRF